MNSTTHFKCARCGIVTERGWSQEEAYKEYLEVIPKEAQTVEDDVVVCTACYIAVLIEHDIPVPPEYLNND